MKLIPTAEIGEFLRLPKAEQDEIKAWLNELSAVAKPVLEHLAGVAARRGVSTQTARRRYDRWRKSGGAWRSLINLSQTPADRKLDREFINYWRGLCKQYGRKCRAAHRELKRQFLAGVPLPGIDATVSRKSLPHGLSYQNLMRYRPSDFELSAARIGRGAAADFRPKIFTTRYGLAVGQHIMFDDMWHDFKVVTLGQRRPLRLLQLHAHDLFSACQFARGLKPRLDNPDGTSVGLKENEMLFLVAHVLAEFGFHPGGCELMVERGTATIREDMENVLFDLTGGLVRVVRCGIQGVSAFGGQFPGCSKGNFRFKASLESSHNLIHNETANLALIPGHTGSNSRTNKPEELHGRERHADALIKAMAALPADRAAMLRLPFVELNNARWLIDEIMERINERTDHDLEGWMECGLTTMDFELPDIGVISATKFLAMKPEQQAAITGFARPRPRKMSPREVFDSGRRNLVRLRPEQTALLLRDVSGREVPVGPDHLLTFEDEEVSPAPLRYLAHHFSPGDKFRVVINPMSPHTAHLFNARGAWVGVVTAWQTIRRDDVAGLHRQLGEARKIESELLAPLAATGARLTRQRIEDAEQNAVVLAGGRREQSDAEQLAKDALG